jgi:hypothetical protein
MRNDYPAAMRQKCWARQSAGSTAFANPAYGPRRLQPHAARAIL